MRQSFDQKMPLSEQRLKVALAKSGRNKKKNHGTGKRNAAVRRAKKAAAMIKKAANLVTSRRLKDAARAYWSGVADDLSGTTLKDKHG